MRTRSCTNAAVKDLSTVGAIVTLVTQHFDISVAALESHCREWRFVWPRWCAIGLVRYHTSFSLPQIGVLFDRDHSGVFVALRGLEREVQTSCVRGREYCALESQLTAAADPLRRVGCQVAGLPRRLRRV